MLRDETEALVDGARRVLAVHGWGGVTMERVAAESGISRMTLHRRGVDKQAVLTALTGRLEEEYRRAMWPTLTGPGTGRERLERALGAECAVAEENMELLGALAESERTAVFHQGEGGLTRAVFIEPLARLLSDGAGDGSLRPVEDPAEVATVLFNTVGFAYRHLRTGHGWTPERARDGVLGLVLEGVVG
jgi:AcrR family transcriptional regulator